MTHFQKVIVLAFMALCNSQVFADVTSEPGATQAGEAQLPAAASGAAASGAAQPAASGTAQPAASGAAQPAASGAKQSNSSSQSPSKVQESNNPSSQDSIISSIQTNIATNQDVANLNIAISNKDGVIKLLGNVNSLAQASTLIEISEAAKGVKNVDTTRLLLKGNKKIPGDLITSAKVKGTFIRENLFNQESVGTPIKVSTTNGLVTLTGTVESQQQADNAVKLAKTVNGVGEVKSELVVVEKHK